jgi:hypothetical protein
MYRFAQKFLRIQSILMFLFYRKILMIPKFQMNQTVQRFPRFRKALLTL